MLGKVGENRDWRLHREGNRVDGRVCVSLCMCVSGGMCVSVGIFICIRFVCVLVHDCLYVYVFCVIYLREKREYMFDKNSFPPSISEFGEQLFAGHKSIREENISGTQYI